MLCTFPPLSNRFNDATRSLSFVAIILDQVLGKQRIKADMLSVPMKYKILVREIGIKSGDCVTFSSSGGRYMGACYIFECIIMS